MEKRWTIKPYPELAKVKALSKTLGITDVLSAILIQRDIESYDAAKDFFRPDINKLHDPFLMKDMDRAVERVLQAIQNKEKILVYGDYDVDGTTSVALVFTFLKKIHPYIDHYIPNRYTEGYGISTQGIDFAEKNNFKLIIALDCGIKSLDKIKYANQKGVDFIICDHHRPGDEIPEAVAVLDPKRSDCNYPYKELSGCGVGFKLLQALVAAMNLDARELEKLTYLVAISTAADIVPITGENRILTFYGLKELNASPPPGIRAILEIANVKRDITVNELVFVISPRINAAGRMDTARLAVDLLIAENMDHARELATNIQVNNTDRRALDIQITQEALEIIGSDEKLIRRKTTVLYKPDWHKGVIGIVASRLTDTYYRPTIMLTQSNGKVTGSARSVKDYDVYEAIDACSHLLEQFGGHKYAAGLTLHPDNLEMFQQKFEEVVSATITDEMLIPQVDVDVPIQLANIDDRFQRILKQFAPFGPGNMAPVFVCEGLMDTGFVRLVGNNHLKLEVIQKGTQGPAFAAIAFGQGKHLNDVMAGKPFKACFTIEENEWNGNIILQLNIKDMKF